MPKPATIRELLEVIRRSRVMDEPVFNSFLNTMKAENPRGLTSESLLKRMVGDNLLTSFQADLLINGKWKGFILGGYRVLNKLAGGGMGQVFLAEQMSLKRKVAIKVLRTNQSYDPLARERFVREAKAAAALDHPNIVKVFDVDIDTNPPFIAMEWVDGISLQSAVARVGSMNAALVAYIGREIALGLHHAYCNKIVHRDIKPANVMIDRKANIKILDLGIARLQGGDTAQLTNVGQIILGTVDYLAPEQAIDSTKVDTRADIYALGATLYCLLTGDPPFAKAAGSAKLMLKQCRMPDPLLHIRPDIPQGLSDIIHQMLAITPDGRFATPGDVAHALHPYVSLDGESVHKLFNQCSAAIKNPSAKTSAETAAGVPTIASDVLPIITPEPKQTPLWFQSSDIFSNLMVPETKAGITASSVLAGESVVKSTRKTWLFMATAAVLALAVSISTILFIQKKPNVAVAASKPTTQKLKIPLSQGNTIVVARTGTPGHFAKVEDALKIAPENGVVEVWMDEVEETLHINAEIGAKKLTIIGKPPSGGKTLWKAGAKKAHTDWTHAILGTAHLDNIAFCGQGVQKYLLYVNGPNITITQCEFKRFITAGVHCANCMNFKLNQTTLHTDQDASYALQLGPGNQNVNIQHCQFKGTSSQTGYAILLSDYTPQLKVEQSTFEQFNMALFCQSKTYTNPVPIHAQFHRNAIAYCQYGIHFNVMPPGGSLSVQGNIFTDVSSLLDAPAHYESLTSLPWLGPVLNNISTSPADWGLMRQNITLVKARPSLNHDLPDTFMKFKPGEIPAELEGKVGPEWNRK